MKMSSFKYLISQGFHNFKNNKLMSAASIGVVTSCLLLVGMCGLLALNVNNFVKYLGDQNEIVIYVKDDVPESQVTAIENALKNDSDVSSYKYVSKEEALQEQKNYLGSYASLLDGYEGENNPLPASFRVHIVDLSKITYVSDIFSEYDGVDYVSTPTELAGVLITLKNGTFYLGIIILIMLFMVSMVVISNTIRLTVYARRKEIGIMKFVGATNGFIQMPFVVEGLLIGTISALLTFAFISGVYVYIVKYITLNASGFIATIALCLIPYSRIWYFMIGVFLIFGWIIGGIGSALSMRRYLKV